MGCGCSKKKSGTPKKQVVRKNSAINNKTTRSGIKRIVIKRNAFSV